MALLPPRLSPDSPAVPGTGSAPACAISFNPGVTLVEQMAFAAMLSLRRIPLARTSRDPRAVQHVVHGGRRDGLFGRDLVRGASASICSDDALVPGDGLRCPRPQALLTAEKKGRSGAFSRKREGRSVVEQRRQSRRIRPRQGQLVERSAVAEVDGRQTSDDVAEKVHELIVQHWTGCHEPDHSALRTHPTIPVDNSAPEVSVVLQPGRRELPACLGPRCDPEGGESGKEPLHANPYARLTQMAMKAIRSSLSPSARAAR